MAYGCRWNSKIFEFYFNKFIKKYKIIKKRITKVIESSFFFYILLLVVIGNTISLSLPGLVGVSGEHMLYQFNIFFITMFTFEMFLKLFCFGPTGTYELDI